MAERIVTKCCQLLLQRELTVAFAESVTAGRLVAEFALVPDAGKFLKGSLVCYDAGLKTRVLKVPQKLIDKYTPESRQVTKAITTGLTRLIPASIHIGITGLAAPGGSETAEKPVGTIFIYGTRSGRRLFSQRLQFSGSREKIILQAVRATAKLIIHSLERKAVSEKK